MAYLALRDNDALRTNPPAGDQYLSDGGSNWLWAVFAIFALSFLVFFALTWTARHGEKIFHYLFAIALLAGTIAYFAMASDLGWSLVSQANNVREMGGTRQIFFAKYAFWVASFPAIIIALGLLSGVSWATIVYNVALSWAWILSYLFSAYTHSNYKWGFFAIGQTAHIALLFSTLAQGHSGARRVGYTRDHMALAGWTNFIWLFYPIAFGLSDGSNKIGVTPSFIFFGILDLLLVVVVAYAFIFLSRKWDYNRLNLAFTQYGRVATTAGTFPGKQTPAAVHPGGVVGYGNGNGTHAAAPGTAPVAARV